LWRSNPIKFLQKAAVQTASKRDRTMTNPLHPWIRYQAPDYLPLLPIDQSAILALRQERQRQWLAPRLSHYRDAIATTLSLPLADCDLSQPVVRIGNAEAIAPDQAQQLEQALRVFCPWKKGPFNLYGIEIDAEWRSDWKWERLMPHIQPLTGRRVADIGCHNGYFMFRMADHAPEFVVGFEPVAKPYWCFQLMQNLVQHSALQFEPSGIEHFDLYPSSFDTIFCLGILYHHPDPIGLLQKLRQALTPDGELVIDCQGIPGDLPLALTPQKRYTNARGIWFLPTQSALENWILRSGFKSVRFCFSEPLSTAEQRRTDWANIDSLQEFLDPQDSTLTMEGYPAPWRFYAVVSG
jgi:tRNA (mo5U34)-methyltransferase